MNEADQQILTSALMDETGVSLTVLRVRYLSIGGVEMENAVAASVKDFGLLPVEERDLL